MTNFIRFFAIAIIAAFLAGYGSSKVEAKAEYTKKENKSCTTCHVKAASKELNDVGKCYAKDKTLKGCLPDDKDKKGDKK